MTEERIAIDLLFAAQPFTGLEHHALHILRGLRQADVSVDVWVSKSIAPDIAEAAEGHRTIIFPSVPRSLRLGREQWSVPWRFGAHPRSYRLLHSITGVAPVLLRTPLVLTVPDLTFALTPKDLHPKARFYFGSLVPRSIRRARRIMVSSEAVRRQVIKKYHIAPEAVACVPLSVDDTFRPPGREQIAQVRKRFGLPERYLLYVGTIDWRKDLGRLRGAYDLLPPDFNDTALVFAGRTNHGAARLAEELMRPGRRGHVIPLGYVPRDALPALYGGASVFIYPSKYEGFGLPVLEAMSCGTAVIVSGADALKELVEDGGVVLRTDTVEELTQAMERLLRFDAEPRRLKAAALKRAAQYSLERLGMQTLKVYQEALAA